MSAHHYEAETPLGRFVNEFEETAIAVLLGLMTIITFINVVLRYGFNTGLIWGLEATAFLFAWLVLFGVSYCVKITAHLGVDAVTNLLPAGPRKIVALVAAILCIAYAALLLKGSWDYWANFVNLPQTTGRWFPTGFQEKFLGKAWYETNDIPMPSILRFFEGWLNEGDAYEKLPRFIPYTILPVGMALLLFRFVQAFVRIWQGKADSLIVSHEAEDDVRDAAAKLESEA
ncbi:TRAP transporter small permease [Oceanomicrobium pacificus]|uniref:TRAP transporter small permease protein n=1 Tax=Oceanomicrobium pacificus TaxID=2692916 RepID=A0A6B0TYR1_9RHOB|nr:TRAP transporter small permease [Oceanomicrobium pacificus]MXU66164.1 TRAP transporter small permease subunit [Oceanomicrobium pacificus]